MVLSFARGGSARYAASPDSEYAAAIGSSAEPVMTVFFIYEEKTPVAPDPDPPEPAPADLEPESPAVAFADLDLESMLNLPGENLDRGDAVASSIPPTEVVARLPYGERGDRTGEVVSVRDVVQSCRQAHPDELRRADHDIEVALRVFVLPDGRIAQGAVAVSSGNQDFDRVVFQCVQAFANVNPLIVNASPVGSWQTISTRW
jgi:outer membrane biosynthesis protein TonB